MLGAREIGTRREYEAQIRFAAMHDALTALPNRRSLHSRLEEGLQAAARGGFPLAVLYLDLDRFKSVNDALGHDAGDELLVEVAERLGHCVRSHDLLARMGGDEFACILLDGDQEAACAVARRMVDAIRMPFRLRGQGVELGASVGVSLFPEHGATLVDLIRTADIAMYQAKARGSGVAVYDQATAAFSPERLALESDLRLAAREGRLRLALQPLLDLRTGALDQAEALARLQRGDELLDRQRVHPGRRGEQSDRGGRPRRPPARRGEAAPPARRGPPALPLGEPLGADAARPRGGGRARPPARRGRACRRAPWSSRSPRPAC